jgi:hypothetical protein
MDKVPTTLARKGTSLFSFRKHQGSSGRPARIGAPRSRGQNNFVWRLVSPHNVLLKLAVGRVSKTRTARNCRVQPRLGSQISSTAGGGLVEILVAQARHDEAIVGKIRIAVRAQDKERVFALAEELIRKDESKTAQSRIARPRQHG